MEARHVFGAGLTPAAGLVTVSIPHRYPTHLTVGEGHRLYFDPSYETEKHKLIKGTVLAIGALDERYKCLPTINGELSLDAVRDDLHSGDEVFVDYTDLDDSTEVSPGIYVLQYPSLLAHVDSGGILIPLCGRVLLKPIWPAGTGLIRLDHANVPVRFNPDGTMMAVPDNANEWEKPVLRPLENEGIIVATGAPLAGAPPTQARQGHHVSFQKGYAWIVTMQDRDYLVMPQSAITGIFRTPETDPELFATITITKNGHSHSTKHYCGQPIE